MADRQPGPPLGIVDRPHLVARLRIGGVAGATGSTCALGVVLEALRAMIETAHKANKIFRQESERFLTHAQEAINPALTAADVREMLIQHVLTEEIFSTVFPNASYA